MKNKISGNILLLMIFVHLASTALGQAKNYYISPTGNDDHTGLTKSRAWKTLERINRETFQPGDAILFESGGTWNGNLHPLGSGERGKMITISSYGKGNKPVINIGNAAGTGITLINQSWWKIQGIEITSGAPPQLGVRREGITAKAEKDDSIRGIMIRDCYIHDMWGQIGGRASSTMIEISKAAEEIIIENNTIKRCDKIGIQVTGRKNVVIRGNFLENLGGDAIIVHYAYRGLIEHNIADQTCLRTGDPYLNTGEESRYEWWPHTAAIWMSHAKETIMQFNEVYHTGRQLGNGDGLAYDFDFGCENNILQYNYSRNNAGFLLIMDNTHKNVARYNISENDVQFRPTQLVTMFCDTTEQNMVHNNVFYVDHGTSDITYYYGDEYGPGKGKGKKDKGKLGAHFRNNIFYATGQGRFRTVYALGDSLNSAEFRKSEDFHKLPPSKHGTRFFNNLYFGPWMNGLPDDPEKIVADPMFVSPGSGRYGLSFLNGYKLKPGSPCLDHSVPVEMEGKIHDFFGNPVKNYPTDVGVYEEGDANRAPGNTFTPKTEFSSHRGSSLEAPENTIPSVLLGWEQGAEGVEIDIHLSKDNRLMVIHDGNTKRTSGMDYQVEDTHSDILRKLDVGAFKGEKFKGEKIPFLEEVIAVIPSGKRLIIELKSGTDCLPLLKKVIKKSKNKQDLRLIAFDFQTITAAKKMFPHVNCHWLLSGKEGLENKIVKAADNNLDGLDIRHSDIDKDVVAFAHKNKLKVLAWTVDDPSEALRLIDLGVDEIESNCVSCLKMRMAEN